ncbi:MAG TPA: twin-arginine translocase TatA/TatE family subunit [Candidatus Limnocylindria bacterium]|nr:twin-arginine translocase TatA/TatE family subunit [Candidatus Limnocylindria bacterium]
MFEGLLQPTHLVLILLIGLIVLGPGKLGDLGGQLGRGIREFKQNVDSPATPPRALTAGDGSRFCTQCGADNSARDRFCSQCGAAMNGGEIRSAG